MTEVAIGIGATILAAGLGYAGYSLYKKRKTDSILRLGKPVNVNIPLMTQHGENSENYPNAEARLAGITPINGGVVFSNRRKNVQRQNSAVSTGATATGPIVRGSDIWSENDSRWDRPLNSQDGGNRRKSRSRRSRRSTKNNTKK